MSILAVPVLGADAVKVVKSAMVRVQSSTATLLLIGIGLTACDMRSGNIDRWYSQEQVAKGAVAYATNCAACHGEQAQGLVADWKRRQPDGSLPPPPLNGTAHAWHHSLSLLTDIIQEGGSLYDGKMPGFQGRLKDNEQLAAIAWFQSLWSDETYRLWEQSNQPQQDSGKSILTPENGEK